MEGLGKKKVISVISGSINYREKTFDEFYAKD